MVQKLLAVILVGVVLTFGAIGCTSQPEVESTERGDWYWYGPNYPPMVEPELGESLDYFDWGTLLPDEPEGLLAKGDGWAAYKRGNFKDYSVLFALSDRGIHRPDWSDRLVEVYPDGAVEIVPEEFPPIFLMDARKYSDGTYSYSVWETGIYHVDENGRILHRYEDEVNGHESLILEENRVLSYSFFHGIARITTWEGEVLWEWDQNDHIIHFNEENYSNLAYHYGTQWEGETIVPRVYNPLQVVKENQADGGLGLNRVQILDNGHKLLSLRNADLVIELDENDEVIWSFGPMVLKHQHCPTLLDNGNILIHDTGNNRAIEVTRDHKLVWEFRGGMVCPYMGMVQRLEDGSTVISDGLRTTATCVSPEGEVLWEVYIKGEDTLTRTEAYEYVGKVLPGFRIYRAWCYPIK